MMSMNNTTLDKHDSIHGIAQYSTDKGTYFKTDAGDKVFSFQWVPSGCSALLTVKKIANIEKKRFPLVSVDSIEYAF